MDENNFVLIWTENGKISSFHRKSINRPVAVTISFWKVSLQGKVILNGNPFQLDTFTLTKGKINTSAILEVQYFDDTPCSDCVSVITISDTKGKKLKQIELNDSGSSLLKRPSCRSYVQKLKVIIFTSNTEKEKAQKKCSYLYFVYDNHII